MNVYHFKRASILVLFLSVFSGKAFAQKLNFLVPDNAIVQFAGSIGYFSVGAGYDLFKNKKGILDFNYGYVPASKGGELHVFTTKFAYKVYELKLKDWGKFYPFNPGFFISYTSHPKLSMRFNENLFPDNYYYWSEAFRPHISIGNELEINTKKIWKDSGLKAISLYSEINTNDYYLVNYIQNTSALTLADIFQLGIGLRVKF
ncbi:hypothetical protein [Pedobacter gandavensis]|uniref:hypothetical protein n=1 Tax=Pedobacter gandavensis TaxID=2679963 RepID=UPI00292E30A6|nr:hypothetical protein [Pedobacter gandavensis]